MGTEGPVCTHCSYSWANVREVAAGSVPQCTKCGGIWTRHNGKPFVAPGSTDEKQDEIGIRALLEQFLSTLPESQRSMVRAAMGFDEVVHVAPKQVALKELAAKHAQVEKRQEDMAKRIIDTQKKVGVVHKKGGRVVNGEMQDHDRACTESRRSPGSGSSGV